MSAPGVILTPDEPRSTLTRLAQQIEDAGFAGIYTPEVNIDALTQCYALACGTRRVRIGTWVANIYYRTPAITAAAAAAIQETSEGRFELGLGISHQPLLSSIGLTQGPEPRLDMTRYVETVRAAWSGNLQVLGARFPEPTAPIPVHLGAMLIDSVRHAASIAEGALLLCCTIERYRQAVKAGLEVARERGAEGKFSVSLGIPTFIDEDIEAAYERARMSASIYLRMPNYNRMISASGFETEAKNISDAASRGDESAILAAISRRLLDAVCLIGPPSRCVERLAALREAGVHEPRIVAGPRSGSTAEWTQRVIKTFGPLN